jgi:signal transduction histidine kinase
MPQLSASAEILQRAQRKGLALSARDVCVLSDAIDAVISTQTRQVGELADRASEVERRSAAAAQRQRFLSEASRILAESLDYPATLRTVARLAVPDIADWCVVDLLQDDGSLARVAIEHKDPSRQSIAHELQKKFPPLPDAAAGPSHVARTGQTEFVTHVSGADMQRIGSEPERLHLLTSLGLNSYISVPLTTRDRLLGCISFFTDAERYLSSDDVAMAEDLARRAATAIDNARLYSEAQRAIRARDDMLAIVSHDLRNPLSAIVTGAALLMRATPDDEPGARVRQRAEAIQRAAQHMTRLIRDLTDIGQIHAGQLAIERKAQDPANLVREVAEALQPVAAERGSSIRMEIIGSSELVECDGDRLAQVLSNLTSNAIKVDAKSVNIRVEIQPTEILFAVSDTGPGIRREDLPHIFDRYWRGEASYKGTGLGLAISKSIVAAHGGRIWVESEVGAGSTFYFTVPRA